ncbi:hypothetical protein RB213_009392 [Colletotrichum asianum]|uniref:Uncharacterized protein n=1 Tax=Colletotrichum asianum TaxID=702518 RepID=A0A8H3WPP7_9PEZI|nr:hypothetical protein GQ607_002158 [Colletotrichum asianum]
MSGATPPLPALRDRRDWNHWSSSLLAYCQVYRTNIQGAPVRFTSSENELMYLMTLGPPEALYDLMYDSLSTEIIDGLRHCGYTFPARSHPNNLLELIKKFLAPSISQRAIHDFASFAKLVKIAAVEDPTTPNEILALLLYRGMEVYDPALLPADNRALSWDALIASLEN